MRNDFLHKGIRALRELKLSSAEKEAVLARLVAHTEAHPAQSVESPYARFFYFHLRSALIGAFLALGITGTGITFAAERTVPGDLLYPVKRYVSEPVQGVLLTGPIEKAQWEAEKTVRRIDEAEALITQGRLSTTTMQTVKKDIEESTSAFAALVQQEHLSSTTTEPSEEMKKVRAEFENKISEHAQVLSIVGVDTPEKQEEKRKERQERTVRPSKSGEIIRLDSEARDTHREQDSSSSRDHSGRSGDEE